VRVGNEDLKCGANVLQLKPILATIASMSNWDQRHWVIVMVVFVVGGARAMADDFYFGQPLLQVQFDQLVPRSSPTITSKFDRLRPTTSPLIDPGVATIPITDNLVHPLDQCLLITSEGAAQRASGHYFLRTTPHIDKSGRKVKWAEDPLR